MKVRGKKAGARPRALSRRQTLRLMGGVAAVAPLATWLGCEADPTAVDGLDGGAAAAAGSGGSDTSGATAGSGGSTAAGSGGASYSGDSSIAWATGGTAALGAVSSYPNPFEGDDPAACELSCELTLGPCHDDQAPEREDISEGKGGLPMRFALRIVDDNCQPVSDADVDIWHCDADGVYSSETSDSPDFCTGDDTAALQARFFRGHRMTDADGVAWFSSCFPGWYSSRAIHVHFTLRRSSRDGDEYLTSQVAFPDDLIEELCTMHPEYSARGVPDTSNTSDTVFPADNVDAYTVNAQKLPDGALLAWKTVIIRSSLSDGVCSESNGGGPGMGGPARG